VHFCVDVCVMGGGGEGNCYWGIDFFGSQPHSLSAMSQCGCWKTSVEGKPKP